MAESKASEGVKHGDLEKHQISLTFAVMMCQSSSGRILLPSLRTAIGSLTRLAVAVEAAI